MKSIATLTMNPTLDVACDVQSVFHTREMPTFNERHSPGGGGINVARVFVRMGGNARCYYLSGGATGVALDGLLDLHQLVRTKIAISGPTRTAMAVFEKETEKEYRFVPVGQTVTKMECDACLEALAEVKCDIFVASGSLPPGAPTDYYASVATIMRQRGIEFVLDTRGPALKETLAAGGVKLVKPSIGELRQLCGRNLASVEEISMAAREVVQSGKAEMVAVTMGQNGALLARSEDVLFLPAVKVSARSAVGAGDSFLAAMLHALARELDPVEAFRYGVAAGSAAVLEPGTELAHPKDIERLLPLVGS
jgi:6-phosphofructokinase 2